MRWVRSPLDAVLVLAFAAFAVTSLVFDRLAALDLVYAGTSDPLAAAVYAYGMKFDPLVAQNPLFLQVMSAFSAFVFGPFHVLLCYALIKRRNWIRIPAIAYAAVMLYSMVVHVAVELLGDVQPPNLVVFALIYTPYALIPALLLYRMRSPEPFA